MIVYDIIGLREQPSPTARTVVDMPQRIIWVGPTAFPDDLKIALKMAEEAESEDLGYPVRLAPRDLRRE